MHAYTQRDAAAGQGPSVQMTLTEAVQLYAALRDARAALLYHGARLGILERTQDDLDKLDEFIRAHKAAHQIIGP